MMGSPTSEPGRDNDERQHRVKLTEGYWMGKYEVTQGQWKKVMGNNPSNFTSCGSSCPVEMISWEDTQSFIRKLNGRGNGTFKLPSEAQWEYAARAGSTTALYSGNLTIKGKNNGPELDPISWYGGNSGVHYSGGYDCSGWSEKQYSSNSCGTHPVGKKQPNNYGLYDMSGNVWEWVNDWKGGYPTGTVTDPEGPSSGRSRVYRGGSWLHYAGSLRSADRYDDSPSYRNRYLGVRLLRQP
ncbi:MAG: formylglycine-generating enzyme family protein [Gammaproteobacteria bacterium]|nr:formylglycine-generating enzyme family protein [Gammaproteobacteria bacterium]